MSWVQETMLGKLETINSIPAIFFRPNMYQGGSSTPESPKTELFEVYVTVSSLHLFSQPAPSQGHDQRARKYTECKSC